jgi:hypothetical protein
MTDARKIKMYEKIRYDITTVKIYKQFTYSLSLEGALTLTFRPAPL